jgi:hypothetical protein
VKWDEIVGVKEEERSKGQETAKRNGKQKAN